MSPAGLLTILLLTAIAPLTDQERAVLATAIDGRDHQEEAFAVLVDHVRLWSGEKEPGDEPIRLRPDVEAMLARPDEYRGDLCRIAGVLQQQTSLPEPWADVVEWFVRDGDGRPILVYVVGLRGEDEPAFRDGREVAIVSRFYKRVDAVARDGRQHSYPAFVGAGPRLILPGQVGGAGIRSVAILAAAVVLGALVLVLLFIIARRQRAPLGRLRGRFAADEAVDVVDEKAPLPDDPADALAELKRRAEGDA